MALMTRLRRLVGMERPAAEAAAITTDATPAAPAPVEQQTFATPSGRGFRGGRGRGFGGSDAIDSADDAEFEAEIAYGRMVRSGQAQIARWDGGSLDDLPLALIRREPYLDGLKALERTVPEKHRGNVTGAANGEGWPGAGENSEWRTFESAEILAVDRKGEALVRHNDYNAYLGADSTDIRRMPSEQAFGTIDRLRAETAEPEPARQPAVAAARTQEAPAPSVGKPEPNPASRAAHAAMMRGTLGR